MGVSTRSALLGEPLPPPLCAHAGLRWRARGQGTLRWSVFEVYRMTYFEAGDHGYPDGDFALEARYLRSLSSQTLVRGTLEEMTRLGPTDGPRPTMEWLALAFPSVERGDRLLALMLGGKHLEMYFNDALAATLDDPILVNTFARIWLSEETRAPELRAGLLNLTAG